MSVQALNPIKQTNNKNDDESSMKITLCKLCIRRENNKKRTTPLSGLFSICLLYTREEMTNFSQVISILPKQTNERRCMENITNEDCIVFHYFREFETMSALGVCLLMISINLSCIRITTEYSQDIADVTLRETAFQNVTSVERKCGVGALTTVAIEMKRFRGPLLVVLGLVGNGMSLFVNSRKMLSSSPNYYMSVLAIADMTAVVTWSVTPLRQALKSDVKFGSIGCMMFKYIYLLSASFAVSILVTMTIERCLVVVFPLRCQNTFSVRKSAAVLGCFAIYFMSFYSLIFWRSFEYHNGVTWECDVRYPKWWMTIDITIALLTPMIVLSLCNVTIAVCMKIFYNQRRKMTNTTSLTSSKQSESSTQFIHITIQTLSVSIAFIILALPGAVNFIPGSPVRSYMVLYQPGTAEYCLYEDIARFYMEIASTMYLMNHVINGYLYCLSSKMFRRDLIRYIQDMICPTRAGNKTAEFSGATAVSHG